MIFHITHMVCESEQPLLHHVQFSSSTLFLSISLTSNPLRAPRSATWGEPCGGACIPHFLEVSRHYGVVVKCFASGQCDPSLMPGQCRSWSQLLQSSKVYLDPATGSEGDNPLPELDRRERFRVFLSLCPRRKSILTTRNTKTRHR